MVERDGVPRPRAERDRIELATWMRDTVTSTAPVPLVFWMISASIRGVKDASAASFRPLLTMEICSLMAPFCATRTVSPSAAFVTHAWSVVSHGAGPGQTHVVAARATCGNTNDARTTANASDATTPSTSHLPLPPDEPLVPGRHDAPTTTSRSSGSKRSGLLERVVRGGCDERRRRFRTAVAGAFRSVARTAFLIVGDAEEASDITQEAFVRALQHWRKVGKLEKPEGWVHRVATNLALSWRRRKPPVAPERRRIRARDRATRR